MIRVLIYTHLEMHTYIHIDVKGYNNYDPYLGVHMTSSVRKRITPYPHPSAATTRMAASEPSRGGTPCSLVAR